MEVQFAMQPWVSPVGWWGLDPRADSAGPHRLDHLVGSFDQVRPVHDQLRTRQRVAHRLGVGHRHFDRHVRDRRAPGGVAFGQPVRHGFGRAAIDPDQQAARAGDIDQPGVEPIDPNSFAGLRASLDFALPLRVSSIPSTFSGSGSVSSTGSAVDATAS